MHRDNSRQRGMVLFIALIVMVAISLTGAALVRSMDTTTALIGNIGFREAAIASADAAVEQAIAAMYEQNRVPDRDRDLPVQSYFASRQPNEDARGIPLALQREGQYPAGAPVIDSGAYHVRYIIERLCAVAGLANASHCNMVTPYMAAAPPPGSAPPPSMPAFRISVRVDGPQNTLSFVQVMLRDSAPPKRLAWRVVTE